MVRLSHEFVHSNKLSMCDHPVKYFVSDVKQALVGLAHLARLFDVGREDEKVAFSDGVVVSGQDVYR